ncbi:hypothetical protein Rsub_11154 [Raphidocelis subcapitata]|uniref:Dolichol-phosphate mannosyltransferase subunit 3 n=1 Tax=Raphidocelis subcapitata TaxID=307507 RepID=A0A2V0PFX0_9CHLO|nr:hypothetical protein Rsub_11154 [Raphidocelis subcapitata]|eukprot:GBF98748.1 hypothetical protein Rsub_11154 [Raphidocelis subcapitata]
MRRIHRIALGVWAAAAAWSIALVLLPRPAAAPAAPPPHALLPLARTAVLWAPAGAVVLLGAYMLAQLAWGVATFRSCPEEADALREDILRARRDLERRGFKFPPQAVT